MKILKTNTLFVFLILIIKIEFLNGTAVEAVEAVTADPKDETTASDVTEAATTVKPDDSASNKTDGVANVESRFYDMGYPGRYDNPSGNYPGNSYPSNGNQYDNRQRPQPGYGWQQDPQDPYQRKPQQGPDAYPNNYPGNNPNNYQGNYPNNYQGNPSNYQKNPNNYPSNYPSNNYPRNNQGGYQGNYPNGYPNQDTPYQRGPNNYPDYNGNYRPSYQNPNYQQPPADQIQFPSDDNGGYQNAPPNYPKQPVGYPAQPDQYPPQGNFQGKPAVRPDGVPEFKPDDILDSSIQFPGNIIRPNQYSPSNPGYNNPNYQNVNQYPYQNAVNQANPALNQAIPASNQGFQGNFNSVPQTKPQIPNNRPIDAINGPNANDSSAAIPGNPEMVTYPPTTNAPNTYGKIFSSTESSSAKSCELTCPTTPEYSPICGTNNVTYTNPGRFNCARNCGKVIYMAAIGRCPTENAVF